MARISMRNVQKSTVEEYFSLYLSSAAAKGVKDKNLENYKNYLIDLENWERKEFYEHFIQEIVCTYSVVVNIDITNLKGQKLYPIMIWLLTKTVNDMPEFRTSLTPEGLGIYDDMHPMCTVFKKENKNFSGIWAYFSEDYQIFVKDYEDDVQKYSTSTRYTPKEETPANSFNISMVLWVEFTSFTINVFDEGKFLLPIFTMEKFFERDGERLLPLAIQIHHAVCAGHHIGGRCFKAILISLTCAYSRNGVTAGCLLYSYPGFTMVWR